VCVDVVHAAFQKSSSWLVRKGPTQTRQPFAYRVY
jgi:hypothetical protein